MLLCVSNLNAESLCKCIPSLKFHSYRPILTVHDRKKTMNSGVEFISNVKTCLCLLTGLSEATRIQDCTSSVVKATSLLGHPLLDSIGPLRLTEGGIIQCCNPSVCLSVCLIPLAQKQCIVGLRLLQNTQGWF